MLKKVLVGNGYTAIDHHQIKFLPQALIEIDTSGVIDRVLAPTAPDYQAAYQAAQQAHLLEKVPADQVIFPGFVDLHVHAPQWPQAGLALDKPLAAWLNDYTFPLEAKYQDLDFARQVYHELVHELLAQGTTTVLFFGTIHPEANLVLGEESLHQGLRTLIGRVAMDNPDQPPVYYRDPSSQAAIVATETFIHQLNDLGKGNPLAPIPVITPRFVPSCTDETLAGLGSLARKYDLPVQSHVSESNWEHQYAIDRFGIHDAAVLDHFGLLTSRTVLAHATQLTPEDQALLRQRQTAIAHCPISNAYFGNGVLPVNDLLAAKNRVGLGTDISGGYSPSLYDNLRHAVALSQVRNDGISRDDEGIANARISMVAAFYLATVGGAEALNLPVGRIQAGKIADLQVVKDRFKRPTETAQERFERILYQTHRSEIMQVYTQGDRVYQA
ncbi:amidohydrolase family protein [Lactobacillus sp. 3B(2020)]|uniref:amidohydrolase family protein n=1 Tax=Lactobacillus sp. 3B(2020) TaxID=2695882 RepID=UPI0015DDC9A9|nr:amidohydrolase family protein [Lactobacillus sp. 3B(2020)]QLL70542.1 amidohydrolase family protein [Lactobacillus sp. 3B(2020)]